MSGVLWPEEAFLLMPVRLREDVLLLLSVQSRPSSTHAVSGCVCLVFLRVVVVFCMGTAWRNIVVVVCAVAVVTKWNANQLLYRLVIWLKKTNKIRY